VSDGSADLDPSTEEPELTESQPDGATSIDAAKVVQPVMDGDGELDPVEHPEDPRAGWQR
jgi:hypothetical protein